MCPLEMLIKNEKEAVRKGFQENNGSRTKTIRAHKGVGGILMRETRNGQRIKCVVAL